MSPTADRHQYVTALLDAGCDPAEVERRLHEAAPWLEAEDRDALWLFAWSYDALRSGRSRSAIPRVQAVTS